VEIKDGIKGEDDGGHLIAQIFNGPGEQINYLPMMKSSNRYADWRAMERKWESALKSVPPKKVEVEIIPKFTGNSKRPDSFQVKYNIGGERKMTNIAN
jgi:predicted ribonuclease toxin of YeeF-YezG toxin-antitoxin module